MKKFILPVLFSGILSVSAGEKITVKPGYENPYTANITRFVPSPLILLGQYKKAYSFCEKQLKELPADSQSLQVLSCWKNMVHALKALQQNEKLEPLRRDLLNRFPRNIPFLAGLDLESIPPYGYWLDHTFHRGEPADTSLPVFSKLKEDRKILLRYLTDPITVKMAQQVSEPEMKHYHPANLPYCTSAMIFYARFHLIKNHSSSKSRKVMSCRSQELNVSTAIFIPLCLLFLQITTLRLLHN